MEKIPMYQELDNATWNQMRLIIEVVEKQNIILDKQNIDIIKLRVKFDSLLKKVRMFEKKIEKLRGY